MVATKDYEYPDKKLIQWVLEELDKRGINEYEVGKVAYDLQHKYYPTMSIQDFGSELKNVLEKREVLNLVAVGLELDNLATQHKLSEPLQDIIANDAGKFGVDENLAINIAQLFGSIAVTNFAFADKEKLGLAKQLDNDVTTGRVNTFADDLFLALCSAVVGRCGHGSKLKLDD